MSMFSELVSENIPSQSNEMNQGSQALNNQSTSSLDELLDESKLEPTALGNAVNNVKVHWNQLLSNVLTDGGNNQPKHDHVKELAENSVKLLKESCLNVTKELHKASLEWKFFNPELALKEEISEYKEAVDRQNTLLNSTEEKFASTLESYKNFTR